MSSPIATFNALHLGDNLIHLHFLRKLAQKYSDRVFIHGAPDEHLAQLYPLWSDLPNLSVKSIAEVGQGAINAWRGAGGWFYQQPDQYDFLQIHLRWFRHLAHAMGLESPITCAADMLFDYPALRPENPESRIQHPESVDFLIINSEPQSGQWRGYDAGAFAYLANALLPYGSVITTAPLSYPLKTVCTRSYPVACAPSGQSEITLSVTEIGHLSQRARCIIGCVTGPMWPCLNRWNSIPSDSNNPEQGVAASNGLPLRIHLLDHERVDLAPNTIHTNSLSLVPELLKERGLL